MTKKIILLSSLLFSTCSFSLLAQNVGIGTSSPVSKLDVEGGVSIGASYSGTTTAPTNGAIIEGSVGIGTSTPDVSARLQIFAANKGLLIPKVALTSTTDASTVPTPANSLLVYNTATAGAGATAVTPGYYYNSNTSASPIWVRFQDAGILDWHTSGNSGTSAASNFIGTVDPIDFVTRTANLERMRVTSAGNIGIGTSPNASAQLHIASTTKGLLIPNLALTATNVAAPVTTPATSLLVYNTATAGVSPNNVTPGYYYWNGTAWQRFDTGNNMGDWKLDGNNNGVIRSLGTNDNFDMPFETNGSEKMRITTGGFVGIGTSNPSDKLHVAALEGEGITIGNPNDNMGLNGGSNAIKFYGYRDVTANAISAKIAAERTNVCCGYLSQGTDLAFYTINGLTVANADNSIERMRIKDNGNVGIGASAPAVKLAVEGNGTNVYATSIWSENNLHVQGNEALTQGGGRGRLRVGTAWGYEGLYTESSTIPASNDLILGASSSVVRVGPGGGTQQNLKIDNGWLALGKNTASTGAVLKKGVKTFALGADQAINGWSSGGGLYNPVGPYNYSQVPMGQLDLPPGASNIVVTGVAYNITGLRYDNDENVSLMVRIGGNESGWSSGSSFTLFGGGDVWFDWNWVADVNWTYTSNQTVQLMFYEEYENCWFCNNDDFIFTNVEVNVYYQYTTSLQPGDISAGGRIYSNSQYDVGDLAEHFEVADPHQETGMIVSLKKGTDNEYILASEPYDELMVGVISENPSLVLNNPNIGPAVALAGRVKVKIAPGESLVKSGDFLTSSPIPGKAVIAKQAGPVIGYAVKNQKIGEDFVEILVQPGRFFYPRIKSGEGRKPMTREVQTMEIKEKE